MDQKKFPALTPDSLLSGPDYVARRPRSDPESTLDQLQLARRVAIENLHVLNQAGSELLAQLDREIQKFR